MYFVVLIDIANDQFSYRNWLPVYSYTETKARNIGNMIWSGDDSVCYFSFGVFLSFAVLLFVYNIVSKLSLSQHECFKSASAQESCLVISR
jgi:hypothetical protein